MCPILIYKNVLASPLGTKKCSNFYLKVQILHIVYLLFLNLDTRFEDDQSPQAVSANTVHDVCIYSNTSSPV